MLGVPPCSEVRSVREELLAARRCRRITEPLMSEKDSKNSCLLSLGLVSQQKGELRALGKAAPNHSRMSICWYPPGTIMTPHCLALIGQICRGELLCC